MSRRITIGVLSPMTGGSYYGKILAGIAREVAAVGGRVVLVQTLHAGLRSDEVVGAPDFVTPTAWEHIDGVISIATATQRNYLDRLQAAGKAVALASDEIDGFDAPSATPDNSTGVVATVDHLVWHGHTRDRLRRQPRPTRHAGPVRGLPGALAAHGIEPNPKWFFSAFDNGEDGGRDVARQLVAGGTPITALVLATDRNAIGCMAQLVELGVDVPRRCGDRGIRRAGGRHLHRAHALDRAPTVRRDRCGGRTAGAGAATWRRRRAPRLPVAVGVHARGSCGCPGEDGAMAPDGGAGFWRDEARMRSSGRQRRENSMREQYEIGIQLLDHERADPRSLDWLAGNRRPRGVPGAVGRRSLDRTSADRRCIRP